MDRVYDRINWENEPSILTPLNATNLNKIDSAVYTIDGRVVTQETTKANQSDLLQCVKQVDYNTTTGVMTFTWQNGTQYTIDLNIEKIPVTFSMDEHGVITMTTADGTQYTADVGALIKTYTFNDSSVIDFTVTTDASGNKIVTADIIDGSITGSKLEPNYLDNCQQAQAGAESAEASADADRLKSEGYAVGTQDGVPVQSGSEYYHNNAKYYSEQANPTSLVALTDVDINNPQNNESLVYNSTTGKWENKQGGTVIEELNDIGDVNITNPTNRQALVYDVTNSEWVNGSGGLLPRMVIQTEVGSTVTITNGSESITAEAQGMGIYFAEIPDFDDWTVTATNGGQTSTQIVTVDTVKIYSVNASYFTAYINVTAPSGSTVTVANGTETYTQTSGYNFTVHSSGTWNITVTKTDASKSGSVSITTDGQTASATFEFATITVDYATEFSGATITATDGTHTYTRVASGTVSFDIADFGTWTISATVSGQTYSSSVVVSANTSYTVSLVMVSYQGWLDSAGITTQYASLAEVLADEKTVRTLFTKQASVDYLVSWAQVDNASATTILNNDYCAKWINLRDYALDTLYADTTCSALMDSADKYFYGEWVERDGVWQAKGNVPIMTANNAPYGEVIASGATQGTSYTVFNDFDTSVFRWSNGGDSYIGYKFAMPICIKKVRALFRTDTTPVPATWNIECSNDNVTWTKVGEITKTVQDVTTISEGNANTDNYYLYVRVHKANTSGYTALNTLQFYGRELKVSVPKMYGNTSPWGEAFGDSTLIHSVNPYNWEYYKPFNQSTIVDTSEVVQSTILGVNNYWGYDFKKSVIIKFIKFGTYWYNIEQDLALKNFKLQGSNDGVQWTDIQSFYNEVRGSNQTYCFEVENDTPYTKHRVLALDSWNNSGYIIIRNANFYGLDYSEHEERHYIYDRGVELETITSGKATIDTTNYNLLRAEDTYSATTSDNLVCGGASANVNGLPNNNYLDISNVNGSNATGWTTVGNITDTSFWVE